MYVILLCKNNANSKNKQQKQYNYEYSNHWRLQRLNTIRKTAAEDDATAQFVSIFCFDTNLNFNRYIVENIFIDTVKNLSLNFM